jgi:hypothetical protein
MASLHFCQQPQAFGKGSRRGNPLEKLERANRFDPSNPDLAKVGAPKSRGTIKHQRLGGR